MILFNTTIMVGLTKLNNRRKYQNIYVICWILGGIGRDIFLFGVPFTVPWIHTRGNYTEGVSDVIGM